MCQTGQLSWLAWSSKCPPLQLATCLSLHETRSQVNLHALHNPRDSIKWADHAKAVSEVHTEFKHSVTERHMLP